jgi:hypothetical protein
MDERDPITVTTANDTEREPWRQAVVPAEPDEDGEIEEVEGEDGEPKAEHLQDHSQLAEAEEDDGSVGTLIGEAKIAELNGELAKLGITDWDVGEYVAAIRDGGAGELPLTPEDMPILTAFIDGQVVASASPGQIGSAVAWYLTSQATAAQERLEADTADYERITDEQKARWGRSFEANRGALKQFIGSLPEGVGEAIQDARMPDGSFLINAPGFDETLLGLAKGRSAPAQKEAPAASTPKERLAEIAEVLRTDSRRYFNEKLDEEAIGLRREMEKAPSRLARPGVEQNLSSQLAAINKVLATDPERYARENMGARAIKLRREIGQMKAAKAARGQ